MARANTYCACRVPLRDVPGLPMAELGTMLDWLAKHGITDVESDWRGDLGIPVADATRLRREVDAENVRASAERSRELAHHREAVEQLRLDLTAAFLAEVSGATSSGEGSGLVLHAGEAAAERVNAGLAAARRIWHATPGDVASEVWSLQVQMNDTIWSFDLGTTLPRQTVEAGVTAAVKYANR